MYTVYEHSIHGRILWKSEWFLSGHHEGSSNKPEFHHTSVLPKLLIGYYWRLLTDMTWCFSCVHYTGNELGSPMAGHRRHFAVQHSFSGVLSFDPCWLIFTGPFHNRNKERDLYRRLLST